MLNKSLIIANFIIVLLGTGVVFYSHFIIKPASTDQAAEEEALKNSVAAKQVKPVPIKKFVVNLHSKSTRLRYLDIEMNVLPFEENQKNIITQNEHLFKDTVIEIVSHLVPDDLDTVTGRILLENKIKKQMNSKLGNSPVVKQIYFSSFVVQ